MAYLYVNSDGVTRPFSTITDAVTTASGGDTIVIDPGTYNEQVILTKELNLRGNTNTPENDDIIISNSSNPLYINRALTSTENIHIEGVTLRGSSMPNYGSIFTMVAQTSSQYLNLIFNRCKFTSIYNGSNQCGPGLGDTYIDKMWFDHCEWYLQAGNPRYAFRDANWPAINDSRILACEWNNITYYQYSSTGSPTIDNHVTTPTAGYGPAYSNDWYIPLATGYFTGYVTEGGTPVQRTINLYDRATGAFIDTTTSDPSTGYYYMGTTSSGAHYLVCLDGPADPLQNDLIIGSAYPTAL